VARKESMKDDKLMGNISTDMSLMMRNITNPTLNSLMYGRKHSEGKYMKTHLMKKYESLS